MADGEIKIGVSLDATQAEAQARTVGNSIGASIDSATKKASKSAVDSINDVGTQMTSFGTSYSKAVTVPVVGAAVAVGKATVDIDTALTGVRKTVDGTEAQYEALKDAAIEFSKTNAVDPAQILDIQALGAQLGYGVEQLEEFGEVVSGLDIATNMSAEQAATELAQFANIMGMSKDETRNYGSTIVELGNSFATTESDISAMAMRIAGAGKQIGMSEADVLGLATALSSMGIKAEMGGSAISTIMSKIDKDVALGTDNLALWAETAGMSVDQFAEAWGTDAVGALSAVLTGMDEATQSGGNMAVMLDALGISEIRQTDTLKRLASNSSFLGEAVETANDAWRDNVALDKEVANRNASMASQMEIAKNKVTALAVEVGEPLMEAFLGIIDAADPLVEQLASGAKAFSELTESEKLTVLKAVAVVAAIGPAVGITGKLTTTVIGTARGFKTFSESLRAVGASLSANAKALTSGSTAFTRYFKNGEKGAETFYKWDKATQGYVKTSKTLASSIATSSAGMKAQAAAQAISTTAMNAGRAAASALGTALKTIAPVAAMTALVAVIGGIASALGDAKKRSEDMSKATDGLKGNLERFNDAASTAAGGAGDYAESLGTVKVSAEEALQSQKDLAESLNDTFTDLGTQTGMAERYMSMIEGLTGGYDELGNKTALTKEEQAKLQLAVDGLNGILGTSYKVVDAENGILSENTSAIKASADAWRERALAQAAQQAYADLLEQQIKNEVALADAEKELKQAQSELNSAVDQGLPGTQALAYKVGEAQKKYDDLERQQKAVEDEMDAMTGVIEDHQRAFSSTVDAISEFIDGSDALKSALEETGQSSDDFAKALEDLGVSTEDLVSLTDDQLMAMVDSYHGSISDLQAWCSANGVLVTKNLASSMGSGAPSVGAAAGNVESLAEGRLRPLYNAAGSIGSTSMANMGRSITQSGSAVSGAASGVEKSAEGKLSALPKNAPLYGKKGGEGYASGLSGTSSKAKAAGDKVSGAAGSGLQKNGSSSSTWGYHLGSNFASGLQNAVSVARNAANNLINAVSNVIKFSVPKVGPFSGSERGGETSGRHLVENFARGMRDGVEDARDAARDTLKVVQDELGAGVVVEMDARGREIAKGIVVGFEAEDPMGQISRSLAKDMTAVKAAAASQAAAGSVYNTTNSTQTLNFNQPISSPDEVARALRMQQRYGLAGRR